MTAARARAEILAAIQHWHDLGQWQRAAALNRQYLADTPADPQLHLLRLGVALDDLAYAATPLPGTPTRQAMLAEVSKRFAAARKELAQIVADFPEERTIAQETQWDIATSFITQARVVDAASPTLARGQYVRATRELLRVAGEYADHPQIGTVPQILWDVATELSGRGYDEEAISVWKDLSINFPTHPLGQQAARAIAQTYQNKLGRPLRAAEVYLEINFARGGSDLAMQQAVFNIGSQLKEQKRWVEALHVLQMFVDAFPQHATAGQALAMIGQIHQANEAWAEAIDAYQRVISNFPGSGQWVQESEVGHRRLQHQPQPVAGGDLRLRRLRRRVPQGREGAPRPTAGSASSRIWPTTRNWWTRTDPRRSTPSSRWPASSRPSSPTRPRRSSSTRRWRRTTPGATWPTTRCTPSA